MIRFSLEKPVILAVGIIIICLFGLAALFRVPIQLIPDLDPRVVTVETFWPGANPQDIEKEIIVKQEEFLRSITGLAIIGGFLCLIANMWMTARASRAEHVDQDYAPYEEPQAEASVGTV